jgi:hypothetical protein
MAKLRALIFYPIKLHLLNFHSLNLNLLNLHPMKLLPDKVTHANVLLSIFLPIKVALAKFALT